MENCSEVVRIGNLIEGKDQSALVLLEALAEVLHRHLADSSALTLHGSDSQIQHRSPVVLASGKPVELDLRDFLDGGLSVGHGLELQTAVALVSPKEVQRASSGGVLQSFFNGVDSGDSCSHGLSSISCSRTGPVWVNRSRPWHRRVPS